MRFCLSVWWREVQVDADYEPYLGPNWRAELAARKKPAPTIVQNHTSIWDNFVVQSPYHLFSYVSKIENFRIPVIGAYMSMLQTIFLDRRGDKAHIKDITQQLIQRQQDIEDGKFRQLLLNPEGVTTNESRLLPFKIGGFLSLLPVQPFYQRINCYGPDSYLTALAEPSAILFCLCQLFSVHTCYIFPQFIPNDYLFEKHADKGKNKAEIFAWAVRDAMSKEMKVEKFEIENALAKFRELRVHMGFKFAKPKTQ